MARMLHPGAWWLWAAGLAVAASRTNNPLLLLLIIAVAGYVVAARRPIAPWSRSFAVFLRIGLIVIAIRVVFQVIVAAPIGTTVLFTLPSVMLPEFLAGVRLGGPVTAESLLAAVYDGLRLATILACVGAANSLASPARLLKAVPAALYEFGVSVVVAVTFAPQLVADLDRVRAARRLRGRSEGGVRGAAGAAVPVLEGALERSVALAAAMDSRGYGRQAERSPSMRRFTTAALLIGLVAAVVGVYGLLDAAAPAYLGLPMLLLGLACGITGFALAGRRSTRTRYRPDPWTWPEWAVTACAIVTAGTFLVAGAIGMTGLMAPVDPPAWPAVPPIAVLGILVSVLPAVITPPVPRPRSVPVAREVVPA
ncbi:MAG: cobalt ABC transporter permease [Actinomycetales bacterium mxb001]|nr:MAG: cobalt ABC transporter permease [Actinomycetales bacterium mxb001]